MHCKYLKLNIISWLIISLFLNVPEVLAKGDLTLTIDPDTERVFLSGSDSGLTGSEDLYRNLSWEQKGFLPHSWQRVELQQSLYLGVSSVTKALKIFGDSSPNKTISLQGSEKWIDYSWWEPANKKVLHDFNGTILQLKTGSKFGSIQVKMFDKTIKVSDPNNNLGTPTMNSGLILTMFDMLSSTQGVLAKGDLTLTIDPKIEKLLLSGSDSGFPENGSSIINLTWKQEGYLAKNTQGITLQTEALGFDLYLGISIFTKSLKIYGSSVPHKNIHLQGSEKWIDYSWMIPEIKKILHDSSGATLQLDAGSKFSPIHVKVLTDSGNNPNDPHDLPEVTLTIY